MPLLISALGFLLDELDVDVREGVENAKEKRELVAQMYDQAAKCQHGDGTALDVEVYYGGF